MNQDRDRRRNPRYPVQVAVRFRFLPGDDEPPGDWRKGLLMTVSGKGAFVRADIRCERDAAVEIELPLRHEPERVRGRVRWGSSGTLGGMGVEFDNPRRVLEDQILDAVTSGYWLSGDYAEKKDKSKSDLILGDMGDLLADA